MFSKFFATAIAIICCFSFSTAQNFEGKMTMKMEAIELPAEYQAMKSMFESTMVIYAKGAKSRVETTSAMSGTSIILNDTIKGESITCIDMMGQKVATTVKYDDSKETSETINGKFKSLSDTKTIAGYKCQKGIYSMEQGGQKQDIEIWYSKDIANTKADMREIPGMVMEMTMTIQNMTLRYTVTEVSKEKVADSKFDMPAGYRMVTQEEMAKMFSGLGQ